MKKKASKPKNFSILGMNESNLEELTLLAIKLYQNECTKLLISHKKLDLILTEVTKYYIRFFNHEGEIATVYCVISSSTFKKGLQMKVVFPDEKKK